jgi:uncharacterized repeat protein (TIGR03803 family)
MFSYSTANGYKTLYSFDDANGSLPAGALINSGDTLYGTTWAGGRYELGGVFSITTAGTGEKLLYSFGKDGGGAEPLDTLLMHGDALYGTTWCEGAGPYGSGVVFSLALTTGKEKTLHTFGGAGDGAYPYGGLTRVGKVLIGATTQGGAYGGGAIYSIRP